MPERDRARPQPREWAEPTKRGAILRAAADLFFQKGYEATTTLEIATLAKTSKRTVYEEFPAKQDILRALIESSTAEMAEDIDIALPATRDELLATLRAFAGRFLRLVLDQKRMDMMRLAIAEQRRSPEIAKVMEASGRQKIIAAVQRVLGHAATRGLVSGQEIELAMNAYFCILLGNLQLGMLLGTEAPPTDKTLARRVDLAMQAVERLAIRRQTEENETRGRK
jgi:AcrR family transcriptional regulator